MLEHVERFKRLLAGRGYRITPQRIAIYEYLVSTGAHPSADQICAALGNRFPMMSPATVYKTLELLASLGLVLEMGGTGDRNRYDANPDVHLNLVCLRCGGIQDLLDGCVQGIPTRVKHTTGFEVIGQRYELYGICPACSRSGYGESGRGAEPARGKACSSKESADNGRRDGADMESGAVKGVPRAPSRG